MRLLFDVLRDTIIDTARLMPFLFLAYLVMEYLENKAGAKTMMVLQNAGKKGPIIGGLLGAVPQCGFSAAAAGLYSGNILTIGTLLAVFLSTSDEMLPIMLSERVGMSMILTILGAKIVVGVVTGILIDMVTNMGKGTKKKSEVCGVHENMRRKCGEEGILRSTVRHSIHIGVFIFLISYMLNLLEAWIGMEELVSVVSRYPIISVFLTGLIGLIPNCASSVAITKLYLTGVLSSGCMFAGLLACAGTGLLVLLRVNKNWKKNLTIVGMLYSISVISGVLVEIIL